MKFNDLTTTDHNEDLDSDEFIDMSNMSFTDFNQFMFNPVNVMIDDDEIVDLVKDANILHTDSWSNTIGWINDNWDKLNGTYTVSQRGVPLYSVRVAH